jgi:putative tryptophan/tyrosine transport system substrate-binding protein
MKTVVVIVALALSIVVAPLAAEAQPGGKVYRVGLLTSGPASPASTRSLEAFRQGLRDLGYVEGQNIVLEQRRAEGSDARARELAAELVQLPVDVLVAGGPPAIRAAQQATRTIPIVMAGSGDPVAAGWIASLGHPGGNMTGLSTQSAELSEKQLELLKETVPTVSQIAILANPSEPDSRSRLHYAQGAAHALRVSLHVLEVQSREDLAHAFEAIQREGIGAFLVLSDPLLLGQFRRDIVDFALRHRLPAMYSTSVYVEAGGLMSYAPSFPAMWQRATSYVDRILKGTTPADLPVEQPTTFELVINLKTAQALGITMPPSVLFQATEILREAER